MKKLKIVAVLMAILMTTNVHAALQSRPGVAPAKNKTISQFFGLIRRMEEEGGALGLNATFATTSMDSYSSKLEETSAPNNIDAHMCKNTEWGTVAMLSASEYGTGYGNVTKGGHSDETSSTTGNMTGVFGMYGSAAANTDFDREIVSAGIISRWNRFTTEREKVAYLLYSPARYVDNYPENTAADLLYIPGDATIELQPFYRSYLYSFLGSDSFVSRGSENIFSSSGEGGIAGTRINTRLAVWVGEGL